MNEEWRSPFVLNQPGPKSNFHAFLQEFHPLVIFLIFWRPAPVPWRDCHLAISVGVTSHYARGRKHDPNVGHINEQTSGIEMEASARYIVTNKEARTGSVGFLRGCGWWSRRAASCPRNPCGRTRLRMRLPGCCLWDLHWATCTPQKKKGRRSCFILFYSRELFAISCPPFSGHHPDFFCGVRQTQTVYRSQSI